jgi:acylpyruvate hydrolase
MVGVIAQAYRARCTTAQTIRQNATCAGQAAISGFGPALVTADELPGGAKRLRIQSRLNGQVMLDANTSDLIFGVGETIELLAECMTPEPDDSIIMGTPADVGQARTRPVWMMSGDTIEVEIQRIGWHCWPA